jgi:hypothetical protein
MTTLWPNHALRTRRERRGCNGFARARSLSPCGPSAGAEFLSPFPKRLKCCVPCAGSLSSVDRTDSVHTRKEMFHNGHPTDIQHY